MGWWPCPLPYSQRPHVQIDSDTESEAELATPPMTPMAAVCSSPQPTLRSEWSVGKQAGTWRSTLSPIPAATRRANVGVGPGPWE